MSKDINTTWGCIFMGTRVSYPIKIKMKATQMRLQGIPVIKVMIELNIRNTTKLKTLMHW